MNTQVRKFGVVKWSINRNGLGIGAVVPKQNFDLVIAAAEPLIEAAAKELEKQGWAARAGKLICQQSKA